MSWFHNRLAVSLQTDIAALSRQGRRLSNVTTRLVSTVHRTVGLKRCSCSVAYQHLSNSNRTLATALHALEISEMTKVSDAAQTTTPVFRAAAEGIRFRRMLSEKDYEV
jgi:hypothetical protein